MQLTQSRMILQLVSDLIVIVADDFVLRRDGSSNPSGAGSVWIDSAGGITFNAQTIIISIIRCMNIGQLGHYFIVSKTR